MSKDPGIHSGEIAWYLCERDADCGHRSSFGGQLAAIQGASPSGQSGSDRWLHLTSRFGPFGSPIAKDRVMRRRWAALPSFTRDVLGAYYTGRQLLDNGDHVPLGKLGRYASVAIMLAKLAGTERSLMRALSREGNGVWVADADTITTIRGEAERVVREAHQAYYDVVALETPADPHDDVDESFGDLAEALAAESGIYSVGATVQREGRWVQR